MSTDLPHGVRPSLTAQVAEEIRVVMTRRRVRQSELARALSKSEQWVSVRLRGVQPIDLNDLQCIADVLGVAAADLLPREGRLVTTSSGLANTSGGTSDRSSRAPERPRPTGHPNPAAPPESSRRPARLLSIAAR